MSTSPLKADSRAEFESEYSKLMGTPISVLKNLRDGNEYRETEGDRLCISWAMWQASRSEIAVDLPSLKQSETGDRYQWSDGVFHFKHDTADILRAAGITVKGDS